MFIDLFKNHIYIFIALLINHYMVENDFLKEHY
jgi:hypothetical protein